MFFAFPVFRILGISTPLVCCPFPPTNWIVCRVEGERTGPCVCLCVGVHIGVVPPNENVISQTRSCACMRIAMATVNRPVDVTAEPIDMSNGIMNMVWCDHACELWHNSTSAVLCTQEVEDNAQCIISTSFELIRIQDQAQLPSEDEEACQHSPRGE